MSREKIIGLLRRLYQYGELGLDIDPNTAHEIELAIDSLESQPEPGEFSRKMRRIYQPKDPRIAIPMDWQHVLDACNLIDRLTKENKELKSDRCDVCGTKMILTGCPHCGEPICCPLCCAQISIETQEIEILKYESHICEAHRPTDLDTSTACPYCEAVKQQAEIERLRAEYSELELKWNAAIKRLDE